MCWLRGNENVIYGNFLRLQLVFVTVSTSMIAPATGPSSTDQNDQDRNSNRKLTSCLISFEETSWSCGPHCDSLNYKVRHDHDDPVQAVAGTTDLRAEP